MIRIDVDGVLVTATPEQAAVALVAMANHLRARVIESAARARRKAEE